MSVEIVPWICREEWEFCRDNLFGEDLVMKKKAVEHLHVWKTRCLNLPLAVECTLILMDTHLQGMQISESETRMLNLMNLELMYSMAVTKFVNFVTDCGTRSSNTLQDFAKELGIPAWIVDLRHKAAHCSSASSLPLLREAVEFCLKWLYDEYWTNADFEDVCNVDENSLIDVENYLDIYLIIKKHVSNDIQFVSQITEEDKQKIYRNFSKTSQVEDFERLDNWSLNETCTITLKKLSKIIKKNPRKGEQLVDKLLEDDSLISPSTLSDMNELSDNAVNIWTDIISVLCASNVSHYLLCSLIKITNDEMELIYRKKSAAIYLNEIFKNILQWKDNSAENNNEESKKSKKKKKKRYDIEEKVSNTCLDLRRPQISHEEVSDLLKLTLEHPSVFVTIYLKNLLLIQEQSIPSSEIDKLLELVAIYNGHAGTKQLINDTCDHTLKSILGEDYESQSMEVECEDIPRSVITSIHQVENQDEPDSNINESNTVWKKCSNDWKWSQTPFGVLPWQEEFKPWLQLYHV